MPLPQSSARFTSAAMNAFAFASHADGLMIFPAIGLGFAVPALVYALTKTGAIMFFAGARND
jgi:hypothetical protein